MILHTDGSSLWSNEARAVKVIDLQVLLNRDEKFGELRVYFDPSSWSVNEHGLIYTDELFESELRGLLESKGFDSDGVVYSEQGMQGDDFVSMDIGEDFIESWKSSGLGDGNRLSL